MMDHLKQRYLEEAQDLLQELERDLLILEENPSDQAAVEKVFRVMHTLKGSSSMFGYQRVGAVTHFLESCFDDIRAGNDQLGKELVNLSFLSLDHIKHLLNDPELENKNLRLEHELLLGRLEEQVKAGTVAVTAESVGVVKQEPEKDKNTWFVYFKPKANILQNGSNPLYILDDLAQLGNLRTFVSDVGLPSIKEIDLQTSYLSWGCLLVSAASVTEIQEVFLFVEDLCEVKINELTKGDALKKINSDELTKLAEAYREGKAEQQLETYLLELKKALGAPSEMEAKQAPLFARKSMSSSIRVASEKLDELMNLMSELVANQARLSLLAEKDMGAELSAVSEEMEKITRRLRDKTFDICLVPIGNTVTRFKRLMRDLSEELNKKVVFEAEGVETELDKNVIEQLTDCLIHIFRNSIDHGIEDEQIRQERGKASEGKILLKAYNSGTNVVIEVQDDGAGIDPEKVKAKALQKGLISEGQELSEQQIFELLFHPGFSTAKEITAVSGRGVGMDVVKKKIKELRGDVHLSSRLHEGTTVKISIPLTISIIDGLLVRVAETDFVIPLSFVRKSYSIRQVDLERASNNQLVLDSMPVPYFDLAEAFSAGSGITEGFAVTISHEDKTVALLVEKIIGEYQAVLKPLGSLFNEQDFLSGASLKGDGTVGLVLDPPRLINDVLIKQNILI